MTLLAMPSSRYMCSTRPRPAMTPKYPPRMSLTLMRATRSALIRAEARSASSYFHAPLFVMPGLVPGIHVLRAAPKNVDGRDVGAKRSFVASPGHDATGRKREVRLRISTHPCSSCPGLSRASTSCFVAAPRTWMAGTSARSEASSPRPAMTRMVLRASTSCFGGRHPACR